MAYPLFGFGSTVRNPPPAITTPLGHRHGMFPQVFRHDFSSGRRNGAALKTTIFISGVVRITQLLMISAGVNSLASCKASILADKNWSSSRVLSHPWRPSSYALRVAALQVPSAVNQGALHVFYFLIDDTVKKELRAL